MANLFEQIVADYLTGQGYLTKLNVNYRKADGKQTGSDIDVLAFHPMDRKVIVGDCKGVSWGLWGDWMVTGKDYGADRERRSFKAIFESEWAEGLAAKVKEEFGTPEFTYTVFCTYKADTCEELLKRTVEGNPIKIVLLADVIRETVQRVQAKKDRSVEPTTLGRFAQLLNYACEELDFAPRKTPLK